MDASVSDVNPLRPSAGASPPPASRRASASAELLRGRICPRHLPRAAAALVWALAAQPLLRGTPEGHDTLLHFFRIPEVLALWRQGIPYARWAPDLLLGYGYPLFQYYPPLSAYLLTALYVVAGGHAPLALGLAYALVLAAAAAGMYRLARFLYGAAPGTGVARHGAALLATATYVLSPHLLYQIYERGSLSNALAMAIYPWALGSLLRAAWSPGRRRVAAAGLALGLLLTAHAGSSLVFAPVLGILGLVAAWAGGRTEPERRRRAFAVLGALALGLGMGAFFWLPALAEIGLVRYAEAIAAPDVHWSLHFADLFAVPPTAVDGLANPGLPITVGWAPLVLGTCGCALSIARAVRRACRDHAVGSADAVVASAAPLIVGGLLLASPASSGLWERSALVRSLQFPWRALDPAALLMALAAGALVPPARATRRAATGTGLGIAAAIVVLYFSALPYLAPPRYNALPERPALAQTSAYQQEYGAWGLTSWGEYLPVAVSGPPSAPPFPGADEGATLAAKVRAAAVPGQVLSSGGTSLSATLRVRVVRAADVTFSTYWFPGWAAKVDGQHVATRADAEGLLAVPVPAGEHTVVVRWGETPIRLAADILSAVALLLSAGWAAIPRPRAAKHAVAAADTPQYASPEPRLVTSARTVPALAVAAALLAAKALVLDQASTPLLRRVESGALAGTAQPTYRTFGNALTLVGYVLDTPDRLTLYWQAERDLDRDYAVRVTAKAPPGNHLAEVEHTHPGLSLTSRWQEGRLVRDVYDIPLADIERPVALTYYVSVRDASTGDLLVADGPDPALTEIPCGRARLPAEEPQADAALTPVGASFGGLVALEGVRVPSFVAQGQTMTVTLGWRAIAEMDTDYTVFVHLIDSAGTQVLAADGPPRGGLYPTSQWQPGEAVLDAHTVSLDLPAGRYRIEIGLYNRETMARLPVTFDDGSAADALTVGEVAVTP